MARASGAGEAAALNGLDGTGTTNLMGFVALFTTDPGTAGSSGEVTNSGYARQACTWNAANTGTGTKTNSTALSWTMTGTAPAVAYLGMFSLVTAGSYSIGAALGSTVTALSITVASGANSLGAT